MTNADTRGIHEAFDDPCASYSLNITVILGTDVCSSPLMRLVW